MNPFSVVRSPVSVGASGLLLERKGISRAQVLTDNGIRNTEYGS